jgi:hypothetical protein
MTAPCARGMSTGTVRQADSNRAANAHQHAVPGGASPSDTARNCHR